MDRQRIFHAKPSVPIPAGLRIRAASACCVPSSVTAISDNSPPFSRLRSSPTSLAISSNFAFGCASLHSRSRAYIPSPAFPNSSRSSFLSAYFLVLPLLFLLPSLIFYPFLERTQNAIGCLTTGATLPIISANHIDRCGRDAQYCAEGVLFCCNDTLYSQVRTR